METMKITFSIHMLHTESDVTLAAERERERESAIPPTFENLTTAFSDFGGHW
jgi:hypothetical protein